MGASSVRLNCEQCQRRKTKCDKGSPCAACKNAGLKCNVVQRARLPRGRSGKTRNRRTELEARVEHIEDLIKRLEAQTQPTTQNGVMHDRKYESNPDFIGQQVQKSSPFVAPDFWTALSHEVSSLRDVLQDSEDDNEPQPTLKGSSVDMVNSPHVSSTILFGRQSILTAPFTIPCPSAHIQNTLLNLYRSRVDCLFKVLHWPTLLESVQNRRIDSVHRPRSPAVQALEYSVYFAALCSITDDECEALLSSDRTKLMQQYRLATETLITKADLFRSSDLAVLQAFVIYLLGLRAYMSDASAWTLLAIAVRVASAHRLSSNDVSGVPAHDTEMRRRLWFSIGVLDAQSSLDRGSLPLLRADEFEIPPLDINDSDTGPHMVTGICNQPFTDMSFVWVTHQAMICQKKLCDMSTRSQDRWDNWDEKVKIVMDFEQVVRQKYLWIEDTAKPFERYTKHASTGIAVTMHLLLRRPPYRSKNSAVPPWDDFNVMEVTTEILERSMVKQTSSLFAPWAWFSWVKWYALAVLLAELCGNHQRELADRAYRVAKQSFVKYALLIADTDSGLLWKPIAKLMRRVQRIRERRNTSNLTESLPKNKIVPPANSQQDQIIIPHGHQDSSYPGQPLRDDFDNLDPFAQLASMGVDWSGMTYMDDEPSSTGYNNQNIVPTDGFIPVDGSSWQDWDLFLADMNSLDDMMF